MKKNGLTKEFLEKHLELWKTKISKRKKWNELVLSYKVKHEELKKSLDDILKIFGEEEIETIQNTFKDYAQKSKNKDNTFFTIFENEEHIKKVFNAEYFRNNIDKYEGT